MTGQTASVRLGKALREARVEAGLSQGEVAARIGVKQESLSAYERGRPTDIDTLFTAAQACGLEPMMLLHRAEFCPGQNDTREVITADPDLDEGARAIILAAYESGVRATVAARAGRRSRRRAR